MNDLHFRARAGTLIEKAAKTFRRYEQNHLDKIPALERELKTEPDQTERQLIAWKIDTTTEKARVNGELADELENFLTEQGYDAA